MTGDAVMWHDIECGAYRADLPLWLELAGEAAGPVLDIGAGTGRVALALAAAGHSVTALDHDPELLTELARRARGLSVTTVAADARSFSLDQRFALIAVPMQTVQLLEEPGDRAAFLRCAAEHAAPGARLVLAVADPLEGFDADHTEPPVPDVGRRGGVTYASQPVAVRRDGATTVIERIRQTLDAGGERTAEPDSVRLADLPPERLEAEAEAAGWRVGARRHVPETGEHVGSTVVVLHA